MPPPSLRFQKKRKNLSITRQNHSKNSIKLSYDFLQTFLEGQDGKLSVTMLSMWNVNQNSVPLMAEQCDLTNHQAGIQFAIRYR